MALLDFTRFGVTIDDVKAGMYSYIIGYDLGDGECAAAYWDLTNDGFVAPKDLKFDLNESLKILSALFIDDSGDIHTGSLMSFTSLADAKGKLYLNFKIPPQRLCDEEKYEGDIRTKKELMQLLLREGLEKIYNMYQGKSNVGSNLFNGKGLLVVGCPSSPEWIESGQDVIFSRILAEGLQGLPMDLKVVIMPESRASLVKVYKEQAGTVKEHISDGVIVMDNGSSTFDVTLIDFDHNRQIDDSIPLGANKIERTALDALLKKHSKKKSELADYRKQLLEVRNAKEALFTNPGGAPRVFLEWMDGSGQKENITFEFMKAITHSTTQSYSTPMTPNVKGSWAELHQNFSKRNCERLCSMLGTRLDQFKGVVILTGGASKMQFINEAIIKLLPHAHVLVDPEPSYCVSRGLVWAAYTDLKAMMLIDKVKTIISSTIKHNYFSLIKAIMAERLAPLVYNYALKELEVWMEKGDNVTPKEFSAEIEKSFLDGSTADGKSRIDAVSEVIKDSMCEYLNNDGDNNVRELIINTVNGVFAATFPGKIKENDVAKFKIQSTEWKNVVRDVVDSPLDISKTLINAIDIEGLISASIKVAIGLVFLPVLIIFYIFSNKAGDWMSDQLDKMFSQNQVLPRSKREDAYKKFKNSKEDSISKIKEAIIKSPIKEEAQANISSQIVKTLSPEIDKAVNVVSLYF